MSQTSPSDVVTPALNKQNKYPSNLYLQGYTSVLKDAFDLAKNNIGIRAVGWYSNELRPGDLIQQYTDLIEILPQERLSTSQYNVPDYSQRSKEPFDFL